MFQILITGWLLEGTNLHVYLLLFPGNWKTCWHNRSEILWHGANWTQHQHHREDRIKMRKWSIALHSTGKRLRSVFQYGETWTMVGTTKQTGGKTNRTSQICHYLYKTQFFLVVHLLRQNSSRPFSHQRIVCPSRKRINVASNAGFSYGNLQLAGYSL